MVIDKETYKVKTINRYKAKSPKRQILLALSLRKKNYHIIRFQHKEFGKTKSWCTYTITRKGKVYEHFNPEYHSDFTHIKKADIQLISVVLENMGNLYKNESGNYVNWINEVCPIENVGEKKKNKNQYWEKFPKEQIKSTVELCQILSKRFGIQPLLIEFNDYHKDINKFKGIVFRSNYLRDSGDINPFFDIEEFNELLNVKSVKQ